MKYDIVINNGTIIDPKNCKQTFGNIGILDGAIKIITRTEINGKEIIDARSKIVAPGFIDSHTHIDGHLGNGKLMALQGVTTVVNGHCGIGPLPIKNFIDKQNEKGFIINQVQFLGHTALRETIGVTDPYVSLNEEELKKVCIICEEELKNGAAGISFGLEYIPEASETEVIELSKIAAKYGKLVSVHSRTDGWAGLVALKEIIDINKKTGASVIVSHTVYQYGFGMMTEALAIIDKAVKEGCDVSCDSGMYTSFATHIGTNVFKEGCIEKWGCTYNDLIAANGKYAGQRMTKDIYEDLRANYKNDLAIALIGEENEIYEAFELPYMMVSSDSGTNITDDTSLGHPQDAGTFPAFFRKLVREQGKLTLVDAVRRCTYLPARRFSLNKKGRMEVGADADIVIFNINTILDKSRFPMEGKTNEPPEGIDYVIVNGEIVTNGKKVLNKLPGKGILMPNELWGKEL